MDIIWGIIDIQENAFIKNLFMKENKFNKNKIASIF